MTPEQLEHLRRIAENREIIGDRGNHYGDRSELQAAIAAFLEDHDRLANIVSNLTAITDGLIEGATLDETKNALLEFGLLCIGDQGVPESHYAWLQKKLREARLESERLATLLRERK